MPVGGTLTLGMWGPVVAVGWILLVTNAINLIDGLDGLAGCIALIIIMTTASVALAMDRFSVVVLAVVVFGGFAIYNNLVKLRTAAQGAWADVDVQLKRRHNLVANLVETVKGYASHEKDTLEKVVQARNAAVAAGGAADQCKAESMLTGMLRQVFALSEAYPDLKANDNFQHLQSRISGLENAIADRREFYNESVNNNNVRIEQFPDLILARFFNFKLAELLEFSAEEKADLDMTKLFAS